jgi:Transposase DDE domain
LYQPPVATRCICIRHAQPSSRGVHHARHSAIHPRAALGSVRRALAPTASYPPTRLPPPRIPDQAVFDKLLQVLVFGCGYRRIADATCSATTIRRRDEWAAARLMQHLERIALDAYDRMIGLDLGNLAVDGCTTKAPCGGQTAGPSPVDRGKQGLKRSMVTDARGIPLGAVPAPANRNDHALLGATLEALPPLGPLPAGGTVHLDRGYDYRAVRDGLAARPARADRRAWQARPDPGRAPLGHRAYPRVDEQLRQAHPLHRAPQARGRVLPRSRQRHRHARSSHPPGLILLPVADTTSAPPLKPRLLAHLLTKGYGSSWIFEPSLTCANALRRVQHPAFALG